MKAPKLAIVALAGSSLALTSAIAQERASPLPPPPPAKTGLASRDCILSRDIRNHSIADSRTLLLDVNNAVYRVTLSNNCLATASSSDPIVIRHPGATYICKPIDLDLSILKAGAPSRCIVESIVKLSPSEAAALPKKLKP